MYAWVRHPGDTRKIHVNFGNSREKERVRMTDYAYKWLSHGIFVNFFFKLEKIVCRQNNSNAICSKKIFLTFFFRGRGDN